MKAKITKKKKKVYALDGFVKVPKSFLVTPFFNSVRSGDSYNKVKIAKYFQYKDLEFTSESLSIFNDFDIFLFIVTETVKQKSNVIEFWFDDLADFLGIEPNHKDTYFKRYCETISKLEQIHVAFFLDNVRYSLRFLELSPAQDKSKKLRLKVDQNYLNFFDSVNELYGVQRKTIKNLKSDYQRILYLMYVTNRANAENHFSVDLLKFRFQVPDTMAERKFVYNIRKANEALKLMGLIEDFSEVKKGGKTVSFKVKYTYSNLHPKKEKKTDISGFEDKEEEEFFDDSSI
ncbi:TPA: hypothetical protein ACXNZZ_004120 [Pseudomonas aeruginosa]